MKKFTLIFCIPFLIGCSSYKSNEFIYLNNQKYKLFTVPFQVEKDTIFVNEIRFYKISSAKNTQQIIYDEFGKWNQKTISKYGDRMNQLVWINKPLLNDNNQFTILADGVESKNEYYSSLIVLDENFKDCIDPNHSSSKLIIEKLTKMMETRSSTTDFYNVMDK